MGRGAYGRREIPVLLGGLILLLSGGAAGCAAGTDSGRDGGNKDHLRVRTDPEPLRRRFGVLGELSEPHWLGYDVDEAGKRTLVPAPDSRIRLVGSARLPKGAVAAALAAGRDRQEPFEPAALTDIPEPLRASVPAGARWLHSAAYDARVLAPGPQTEVNASADGRFLLDEERDVVWFDTVFLYA
ncbi:hypothetical protein [Streptomyces sp. NPDC090022]|uniref:hypothetical protein n=1 Tax=Streptomyces sp. NPDC090022 TaxID=3365920 RepID=UPI003814D827